MGANPTSQSSGASECAALGDLVAAIGAYTGFGPASPLSAEIVAGIMMAAFTGLSPLPGGAAWPPGNQASHRDIAAIQPWPASPVKTLAPPADGQLCTLIAVDIAGFTRADRDDDIRLYMHQALYEILQKAFDRSGIPWAECFHEDRGDGALIVIPPGTAGKDIIDPLPERLRGLIRRHNHVSCEAAGIQLRAAIHTGPVEHDEYGFVGTDINFLFRMLEARPLKRALADSGADLALIISDDVYRSLVCRYPSLVSPACFEPVRFQAKQTRARAWTYLPGAPLSVAGAGDPAIRRRGRARAASPVLAAVPADTAGRWRSTAGTRR